MKHLFVVNPHSFPNPSALDQLVGELKGCFSGERAEKFEIHIARYPRDGLAVVYRYLRNIPPGEGARIYAVGGEGILFDCLNGMVDFPNAELTNVPYGSANDFVRAFGKDAARAFRNIPGLISGPSRPLDVIHYGANYALNEANVGLIGQTIIHANALLRGAHSKWFRPHASKVYLFSGIRALFNPEVIRQPYEILADGEDLSGNYTNIHICNGPCNGGSMIPSPYASPEDGLMDVILGDTSGWPQTASVLNDYTAGKFEKYPNIFGYRRCRAIEIKSKMPLHVELDGEGFYAQEIKMELIPGKIRFFTPIGMDFADYSDRGYKTSVVQR